MATSGDYNFSLSSYKIITGAMRLIYAIQSGEVPPAEEYDDALDALNGMVTHWQASGIHVWSEIDCTLFLQPNQITYQIGQTSTDHCCASGSWTQTALTVLAPAAATTIQVASIAGFSIGDNIGIWLDAGTIFWTTVSITPSGNTVTLTAPLPSQASSGAWAVDYPSAVVRPLKVPAGRRYLMQPPGGQPIETPMGVMSRLDYGNVPNKNSTGMPTSFFYDPQLVLGVMSIWPAPSDDHSAIKFTAQRPLQDFLTQRDTADLPQEWISALRFNLAVEMSPEYDVDPNRFQMIKLLADEKKAMCMAWDREPESVYFGLENRPAVRN
jgi:hypothetical protein